MSAPSAIRFHFHRIRRDISNFALLKSRDCDGQIVSQHQSGTHWLKFMMANVMAVDFDIPPPQFNHANDIIGGPKDSIRYPQIPRIVSSHSMPPIGLTSLRAAAPLQLPKYIVLVRDIRASLVSNFRKWETRYGVSFGEYLRGDPAGRQFNSDIWWCIRFHNAWGAFAGQYDPSKELIVHYENLVANTRTELKRVFEYLNIAASEKAIDHAITVSTRQAMEQKDDPARPPGAVHLESKDPLDWFSDSDRKFVEAQSERFLRYRFGYDYRVWS